MQIYEKKTDTTKDSFDENKFRTCWRRLHPLETQISHVLQAIGLKPELAKGTIRLSFGRNNSENDVDIIIESLRRILG